MTPTTTTESLLSRRKRGYKQINIMYFENSTCSRRVLKHRRTIRRKQLKAYLLLFVDKRDVIRGGLFTRTYIIVGGCLCVYIHIYINSCSMFIDQGWSKCGPCMVITKKIVFFIKNIFLYTNFRIIMIINMNLLNILSITAIWYYFHIKQRII